MRLPRGSVLPKRRVFKTVHKYGKTSASAVAIALHELIQEKELAVGENILLVAFGAGFTWGASILTKMRGRMTKRRVAFLFRAKVPNLWEWEKIFMIIYLKLKRSFSKATIFLNVL